jgi:hypothetical protein
MSAQPQQATVESSASDIGPEPVTVKRMIHVNVVGTMSNFGLDGPIAAQWKPLDGKLIDVLGPSEHSAISMNVNSLLSSLSTAIIKKAVLVEHQNNFPVPLGVSVTCLPSEEVTETGEKYAYTALPRSKVATPQLLFEADANNVDSLKWTQQYPGFNANNLESHMVMDVANTPYVFLHQKHPCISLLRANADLLGANIDEQPMIDGEWYKVTRSVFATCCNTLRKKILPRLNTKDLTKFSVQLHRLNGEEWGEMNGSEEPWTDLPLKLSSDMDERILHEKIAKTPYSYMARIELTYEIQPPV